MRIFTRKIYQQTLEAVITLVVTVSFVSAMIIPQVVNAETQITTAVWPLPRMLAEENEPTEFPAADERQPLRKIWVLATAYSSTPDQTDDTPCVTANGYDLCSAYETQGEGNTIAANFLFFNQQVKLPDIFGGKILVVRDRMNQRYGRGRIDVWLPTREEAKQFGVKWVEMEIF